MPVLTDTNRIEKFDRWLQANGWIEGGERIRFMDEHFKGHLRDFIDSLPEPRAPDQTTAPDNQTERT